MNFQDYYKIFKRKRIKEYKYAKKTIKNIMKNFDYVHIDEQLLNYGFEPDYKKLFGHVVGKDLFDGTVLYVKHKKVANNYELELCMHTDIRTIPNTIILTVMYGKIENKKLKDLIMWFDYIKELN